MEIIRVINNDYAGIISLLASLIMVVVTIIYVRHTKKLADYSKESVELVAKQMKTDKQPCIIPLVSNSFGTAFDTTNDTRMQLGFDINLKNVGNSPAIIIYSFAHIELQLTVDDAGNKKVLSAALLPYFVQALSVGEEKQINIHFETEEVKSLIEELKRAMDMNWKRMKTDPTRNSYVGALLGIQVLFRNIMGQWYKSYINYEIPWLEFKNPLPRKTNNINENTIPPKQIKSGDEFRALVCSNRFTPFSFGMTTKQYVNSLLDKFVDDSPWLKNSIR